MKKFSLILTILTIITPLFTLSSVHPVSAIEYPYTSTLDEQTQSGSENSSSSSSSTSGSISTYQPRTDSNCNFLGLVCWDNNLRDFNGEDAIKSNIWQIAANVATDVSVIATYLVLGYIIYGGYLYITSSGDTSKVMAGKKTLSHTFIGLAITISANVILSTLRIVLLNNNFVACDLTSQSGAGCIAPSTAGDMVMSIFTWVTSIAGIVAAIFVVIGGVTYMTSSGNPSAIQKAKQTIIYALIGLAIVAFALTIENFVANIIRQANQDTGRTSLNPSSAQLIAFHPSHSVSDSTRHLSTNHN